MVGLDLPSRTRGERHNLLNNYISALLMAFIDAGLIEGLIELGSRRRSGQDDSKDNGVISTKATLLLGELLYLTNTHLPSGQCARVQVTFFTFVHLTDTSYSCGVCRFFLTGSTVTFSR